MATTSDLLVALSELRSPLLALLREKLEQDRAIKWYEVMQVMFKKYNSEGEEINASPYFRSCVATEVSEDSLEEHVQEASAKIKTSFDEFIRNGSGWTLESIGSLEVKTARYHPLAASTYVPLPQAIAAKKAVLNIQNEDNKCLVWCLLAAKMNIECRDQPHRVAHYLAHEGEIKLGNVQCPVPISKIHKIEAYNQLRINVYGLEKDEVFPLSISKCEGETINLLLISNEKTNHYCRIRNMSLLLGNIIKHKGKSF